MAGEPCAAGFIILSGGNNGTRLGFVGVNKSTPGVNFLDIPTPPPVSGVDVPLPERLPERLLSLEEP